jgi:hypothetical protein
VVPEQQLGPHSLVACRCCSVARELEQAAGGYGPGNTQAILALAASWRQDCRCSRPRKARTLMSLLYRHIPHPHIQARRAGGPVKTADQHTRTGWYTRANARIALLITAAVGSMTCAWLFAALAVAGLPMALKPGNIGFLFWFSSDLLQLTLLSVIIVGQNIQARAADKRAEQTFQDAEAILAEALKIQEHLQAQDDILTDRPGGTRVLPGHDRRHGQRCP